MISDNLCRVNVFVLLLYNIFVKEQESYMITVILAALIC